MTFRRHLGRGFAFPMRIGPHGGFELSSGEKDVQEAIWILLSTAPGERVMRPDFGCGIHEMVFAPNNPTTHVEVQRRVRDALVRFEPRIDVAGVSVASAPERPNVLLIRIDYRIRDNNAAGNVVYPFFLSEGEGL